MKLTLTFFAAFTLVACEAKTAGEACDKFFQNSCQAPLSCVHMPDKAVCGQSCEMITAKDTEPFVPGRPPPMPTRGCKDPKFEMVEVKAEMNGTDKGSMGCYCLPRT